MMALFAQVMLVSPAKPKEGEAKPPFPGYRPFCKECNDVGRDARHPCPGH